MYYRYRGKQANLRGPGMFQACALLNISHRTYYRWIDAGRLSYPPTWEEIDREVARRAQQQPATIPTPRPRGPKRNPLSRRYTIGRHSFSEKASG